VTDLADARVRALDCLRTGGSTEALNLGNGEGYSVMQVTESIFRVADRDVPFVLGDRRPDDPPSLVASGERARLLLDWVPQHPELDAIASSGWDSRSLP